MRLFFAALMVCATAASARDLKLTDQRQVSAGPFMEELKGDLSLDDAIASTAWRELHGAPNYGFTSETIWLKLVVSADEPLERVLYADAWMKDLQVTVIHRGSKPATQCDSERT